MALLEVRDLCVTFNRKNTKPVRAVDGLSFSVDPGETVGLVGESGCGKSVTSLAIMGLLPKRGVSVTGEVIFNGRNLLELPDRELRDIRGKDMAMIFQDPMSSLNPVVNIGIQITEVLSRHRNLNRRQGREEAEKLLSQIGISDAGRRLGEYPHQLSGGMRQRILIAVALACKPQLLIADEPTTALDVTIQAQIIDLLKHLVHDTGSAMVMITHDLGVVADICDQVNVMYSGRLVEAAPKHELFAHPRHRYTSGLMQSVPRLDHPRDEPLRPIPGSAQNALAWSTGCAFAPRCGFATNDCIDGSIQLRADPDSGAASHDHRCVNPNNSPILSGAAS